MGYRVEYEVRKLPDSYVTKEMRYSFVDDEKAQPDRFGRKRQKMVSEEVESRGGWLFIVRGKPGHSFRLTSLDQIKSLGLSERPRLIDNETGEEVNEQGIPLSVVSQLEHSRTFGNMSGPHGTDIDVTTDAADMEFGVPELGDEANVPEGVQSQIEALE